VIEIHPIDNVLFPSLLPPGADTVPDVVPSTDITIYDKHGYGVSLSGFVERPHVVFIGDEAVLLIEP